jgi:hypothetical protein
LFTNAADEHVIQVEEEEDKIVTKIEEKKINHGNFQKFITPIKKG